MSIYLIRRNDCLEQGRRRIRISDSYLLGRFGCGKIDVIDFIAMACVLGRGSVEYRHWTPAGIRPSPRSIGLSLLGDERLARRPNTRDLNDHFAVLGPCVVRSF